MSRATTKRSVFDFTGSTGLHQYSGYVREEFLRELQGDLGTKTYREMRENHPVVGAMLMAIESVVKGVKWNVQAADESPEEQEKADFVTSCLSDMEHTWEDFIADVTSMVTYGWSLHEKVFKVRLGDHVDARCRSRYDDGRVGWRSFAARPQDTLLHWRFDANGAPVAMVQMPPVWQVGHGSTITIPLNKCLLFRTTIRKNNPEGRSLLRNAYVPWYYQKRIMEIEAVGIERDLAGLPVALVPAEIMAADAGPEDRAFFDMIKTLVKNIRSDEQMGLVFPSDRDDKGNLIYEFKLMSTGGTRSIDVDKVITRYDSRIAMVLLADFVLLGHDKVGSFALSNDKTSLFAKVIRGFLDTIAAVFNREAIPELLEINGFDTTLIPTLVPGDMETSDLAQLQTFVSGLVSSGVITPDDGLEDHLREQASLPPRNETTAREAGEEQGEEGAIDPETGEPVVQEPDPRDQEQGEGPDEPQGGPENGSRVREGRDQGGVPVKGKEGPPGGRGGPRSAEEDEDE